MSSEPKKVDRRKFIYAGLGAVALVAIGAAAYVAMNPPVVTQTVTTSTTVPTTSVVTTTSVATTTLPVTVTTTKITGEIRILDWSRRANDLYRDLTAKEFTPNTGIQVVWDTPPWSAYLDKNLATIVATTSPYDVIVNNTEWTLPAWVYADKLLPLNSYIQQSGLDLDDFLPGALSVVCYPPDKKIKPTGAYTDYKNGIFYGIPLWLDSTPLMWRTDFFKNAGITNPPTNNDEFLDYAIKLTGKGVYGYVFQGKPQAGQIYDAWFIFIWRWGTNVFDENLNPAFNTSEGIEATQFFVDLLQKYHVVPDGVIGYDHQAMLDFYKAGGAAMAQPWGSGGSAIATSPLGDVTSFSKAPYKKRIGARAAGSALTIPKAAPHPDLAWKFIEWAVSKDVRMRVGPQVQVIRKSVLQTLKEGTLAWAVGQNCADPTIGLNPAIPNLVEVSDAISPYINDALSGKISVKEALSKAEEDVKKVIQKIKVS